MKNVIVGALVFVGSIVSGGAASRVEFAGTYAPSESWVKPAEKPYRQEICLNGSWQFQPVRLPEHFKEGVDAAPPLPPVKENGWEKTPLRVPSPWNVNSFADKDGLGGDFRCYPSYPKEWEKIKMGWLRKKFTVPADWSGRRIQLHFLAVAGDAEIVLNGQPVGKHFGIFLPFDIDITPAVQFGKENELVIGVRKPELFDKRSDYGRRTYQAGSFWGQHAVGIWQDVFVVALPEVRAADVYVKPQVDTDTLEAEVTLANDSDRVAEVSVNAQVFPWISKAGKGVLGAPLPSSELNPKAALDLAAMTAKVPAHGTAKVTLSVSVKGSLKLWSPEQPNLYGLVVRTSAGGKVVDSEYTRFGWRQFTIKGTEFLINGKPFAMKGDSWHFMGIPQMTRRYAWAWYQAMRDANLNAVRLHAQPYPSFYLDVADEMGILVLDESAMWASDGGPKLNDEAYWKDSEQHMAELVLRDRNHASVFGWSISNEIMPIVRGVMRNPPGMKETLVKYYGVWADICRKLDPTRQWISADGEDDGEGTLPTYLVHYGGPDAMKRAFKTGKPWGVGEAGNAYYGTPEQVAETNGGRAYESFLGRMEGVAASSYQSLVLQREHGAAYRSVFNLAWYALRPLPLGMKDTSHPPTLEDGIHFTAFEEGQPGVQPERLGPYSTTLNPGYDPALPLYETWPLFDAIHDASAEPPLPCKWVLPKPVVAPAPTVATVTSAKVLGGDGSKLASELKRTGVLLSKMEPVAVPAVLFVDGTNPPAADAAGVIKQVLDKGGTVVVWGVSAPKVGALNALLPLPVEVTERKASSLLPVMPSPVTAGLSPADLYFSELRPAQITTQGLDGKLVKQSEVLLKACDTDWLLWNKQAEYAKTGMVHRSELEAKPAGAVMIEKQFGTGRLLVTTLPAAPRLSKGEKVVRAILANLGLPLGTGADAGKPLLKTGDIVRVLAAGTFPAEKLEDAAKKEVVDPAKGEAIRANVKVEDKPWTLLYSESGLYDFEKAKLSGPRKGAIVYLSFWVSSPRPLDDLLLEPNIPVVNFEGAADDALQVWLNGKLVAEKLRTGPIEGGKVTAEALKLHQGWNHFLIKVIQMDGGWQFTGRLTCSQPDFLAELESALEKP